MKLADLLRKRDGEQPTPSAVSVSMHIRGLIKRGGNRMGVPGVLAIGLLVFAAAFYFSWLREVKAKLGALQDEIARSHESGGRESSTAQTAAGKLASFYQFFPHDVDVPNLLEKIYDGAEKQALKLDQGEYRAARDGSGKLIRYQITLPVKGSYPQIRKFVSGVLTDIPAIALDNIHFERQKIGESTVEAKIKLVIYLEQAS